MGKTPRTRADRHLVEIGLAETRERAQALILAGHVYSPAGKVLKPGCIVSANENLEVRERLPFVGRGGIKLAHALDRFRLDVSGFVALDVGASTGGFTDCLLQQGATRVYAVDVGYGQLDYNLRRDPRVVVMERVNARYPFELHPPQADETLGQVHIATVDVSFISATKIILSVAQHVEDSGCIIVLVKPQFEAKRGEVGRGGVIKDPQVHAKVLARFIHWLTSTSELGLRDLAPSPILGDAGNREFFVLLRKHPHTGRKPA